MCLFRRSRNVEKPTRQHRRKLQRDLAKLERKVRCKAEHTLKDDKIPQWIRDVKRKQLEHSGFLTKTKN